MITTFKVSLIIVILVSLLFTFEPKGKMESKLNASLLCVVGIAAFIISSIVL